MRAIPVLILILIGSFFILARNLYAKFLMSFAYQIPAIKKRETVILQSTAVISVCFGAAFIVLGVLMALNVVFPA
jgi:hypothetical protein